MKNTSFIFAVLALSSCAASIPQEDVVEAVPSELSIEHFANMQLIGTGLTLHAVLAENSAYTRHQISYNSNGLSVSGIMNIPKGDGPFPLVVFNHGYINPSVYTVGRGLKREQDYLAREGFAVLHTDYRGHGESDPSPDVRGVYDAALEYSMDSINAIHAVRAASIPNVDATRVGMLGHSLGGGVTLNVAVAHPDLVDALVLYAPVHSNAWENFMRWRDMREEGDRTREMLGTQEENPKNWERLSSLTYLERIDDPALLFHGTNDADVPISWSEFLHQQLQENKKEATYIVYENEKHEFVPQWNDFMQKTAAFFTEHLKEKLIETSLYDSVRITKKPFGVFITPESSPVAPERFRGFHTGIDFELISGENASAVGVYALCKGEILSAASIDGYGGVIVQSCSINGDPVTVLYGHLSTSSFAVQQGDSVQANDLLGHLGKGFSRETDGERPHLHLAVHKGSSLGFRGYVP